MKMLVIGGVAAGMSAAARARRLDETASIIVFERGDFVSFANCGLPYHIGGKIADRDQLLLQTPQSLAATLNLDVRTGTEVEAIDRAARQVRVRELAAGKTYTETYDKLVLAPGAAPLRPPLPGIDHPRICVLRNIADMDRIQKLLEEGAKAAVVIGGGYIGVEMAENLRERGLAVDLVEMVDQVMPPLDREMARPLENHLRWHGVNLHLGVAAAAFTESEGRLRTELVNGQMLMADLVILSAGVKPDLRLARAAGLAIGPRGGIQVDQHMRTNDPHIYAAGDAVEVTDLALCCPTLLPLAGPANRQGRIAGENVCGRHTVYTATQGTAIVKVFEMTGGGTGANEKSLQRAGINYRKIYLHPSGHAGYYPGSAPMNMKVLFAPGDGKLLGAQVVGYDGVDKRLDVLATAIRAGLQVHDLESLELAYAPPYGSAKDPVNMAGFIGTNLLHGDLELWYPEEYPDQTRNAVLLDVRSAMEYDTWHIPGAVNIPLDKLRGNLDRLPRGQTILVYCKVGFRSYLAYRLLKQRGYDVKTLSGGTMTFCNYHRTGICPGTPEPPLLSYAEERQLAPAAAPPVPGRVVELNCAGMQCPGPIRRLAETMQGLQTGDELIVSASDPGFTADGAAWCRHFGHTLVSQEQAGPLVRLRIRKGGPMQPAAAANSDKPAGAGKPRKTMVVFSGDLDKVLAAFVIANGAVSMGSEVVMFFTFWGINALRRSGPQAPGKTLLDRIFGWMMPQGAAALRLSQMHMGALMRRVMRAKQVDSLPGMIAQAQAAGVKLVVCSMSMDVMGLKREELIDGLEIGGVAAFLGESAGADMTLFI